MKTNTLLRLLCLTLFGGVASAQGVQNSDISLMFGPTHVKSQEIPGSSITAPDSTGHATSMDYGYQVVRKA